MPALGYIHQRRRARILASQATMPVAVPTQLPQWTRPQKTKVDLPWADIKTLDFAKYDQPGGEEALARELDEAIRDTGFFSLVNTGFEPDEVQRQYDIGQSFFDLPSEEKDKEQYAVDFSNGNYFGYKRPNEKTVRGTQVRDNVETLNIPKFIKSNEHEPFHPHLEPFRDEIEAFSRVSPCWDVADVEITRSRSQGLPSLCNHSRAARGLLLVEA